MQHRYRLLCLFLLGLWFSSSPAQAQYQIGDYLVRAIPSDFQDISGAGQDITGDIVNSIYDVPYMVSKSEYTIPFNFRWINTVSNKVKVTALGGAVIGGNATVPEGRIRGEFLYYSNINYRQSNEPWNNEYVYNVNNMIHAWRGYFYGHSNYKVHIATRGTAPNRQFVIQATGLTPAFTPGTPVATAQVILHESGISKIEFQYRSDVDGIWSVYPYQANYPYYGPFIDLTGEEEVSTDGGWYERTGGTNGTRMDFQHYNGIQPGQAPPVNYSTWGGYPWANSQPLPSKGTPAIGYRVFIAYPYDLAAGAITNPQLEQILNKDVAFTPTGVIINEGSASPSSAIVNRRITLLGVGQVYNKNVTITPPGAFGSSTINFDPFTPVSYGIYLDTMEVISTNPADQYADNNVTSTTYVVSPPNNMRGIAILSPAPNSRTPINIGTPISARFRNLGANNQTNVPVTMVIRNPANQVVYRDTIRLPFMASGEFKDTTFREFTPTTNGNYRFCAIPIMPSDELRADDTACATALVAYENDAAANVIVSPEPLEEKPEKKVFQVFGRFRSVGVSDLFDIPMRLIIKRCSDNAVVFLADTMMNELNVDQGNVSFGFPTEQGSYDVRELLPGCYTACVIARYPTDGDRSNDTTCTSFSIIPQLKGDIEVGFGRRFPTISAAVDSMRFRGVGGPLNLILTDNYYVENGNTSVSTQHGAVDFRGIIGTGENSVVTWKPVRGVSPRIAIYGNRPHGFYFGQGSPSHMVWDGMNQLSPTAELRTQDPLKRGITIVDSSSVSGATIAIEHGFSNHMTFKNLNVIGRGMLTSDSSSVYRLYNERSLNTFLNNRITDTMPNHHIVIENNAIGNARYGIWDRGMNPLFSIGPAKFFDRRNYSNVFTRNTIGSAQRPIGTAGIAFENEQDLMISMNEISNVNASLAGGGTGAGIMQMGTGNVERIQINGNKIHNVTGGTWTLGVQFAQSATVFTQGTGANQARSVLPTSTANRVTNNMIWDLKGSGTVVPVSFSTMHQSYWTNNDSVYHNSISTNNAMYNVYMSQIRHPFVMNNIIQNTSTSTAGANFYFEVPRPFASRFKSDYNLFDLAGNRPFAVLHERDSATGNLIQSRTFRRLNDWRTFTEQDVHSIVGNPMFQGPELDLPGALSYIPTPASNNGIWIGSQLQARDIDGDLRQMGNLTPDMGADEVEGFELTNDLGVMAIFKPAGYSSVSDTTFYVAENPLHIQALVKNLSNNALYNRTVNATLEVALNGGQWQTLWSGAKSGLTFDLNESKIVDFQGPVITQQQEQQGVFRVTISTAEDQNNVNNQQAKSFRLMIKRQAVLVSYDGSHARGIQNKDSVTRALIRLGVRYDSLNRANFTNIDIDYTPWWTVVYTLGDAANASTGALSFKQTEELTRYLNAGRTYAKKSLVLSGQNIAFYNDFGTVNGNGVTDREFMRGMLRTRYVASTPVSGTYADTIDGRQVYFQFREFLNASTPDVVWKTVTTPPVGEEVSGIAYTYRRHTATPADSGAGTTWAGRTFNTVFFGFDWADLKQSRPGEGFILTSGATRVMRGALDFIQASRGTVLPVNFVNLEVKATEIGNEVTWQTAEQKDVARFEIETLSNENWTKAGEVSAKTFTFTDAVTANGTYSYRVVAVDLDGSRTMSQTKSITRTSDRGFALMQNYPNPFVSETEIGFTLAEPAMVTITVLDVTGKVVATVTSKSYDAGTWNESLNAVLPNGNYVYEMTALTASGEAIKLQRKMSVTK